MSPRTRYHVVSKIARGGMAEIFLALQQGEEGFQKPVVLKRILPTLAADPKFVRMLVDEAHIASTLNHSNLVQVLDLGRVGDQYFLVLEFVDGWNLEQIRRRARDAKLKLPTPLALTIVSALCRGLAYVHTRERDGRLLGIVHRDVTPQNVLISQHGEVKLADFGIAKAVGKSEKSATGVIKGKFAYMSPEQTHARPIDARSDLFSVGAVLYLLTTGRKPFDGPTDADVIMQVRRARPEKPSMIVRDMNQDVERLINRALRADPDKRWQTAEQMADRIDAILVKMGQPSGPAPLKRWLETLSARDGAKPPVPAPTGAPPDPSIAIDLGSLDIELEEIAATDIDQDEGSGDETSPARTRAEATAYNQPTREDASQAAQLASATRTAGPTKVIVAMPSVGARFKRWLRRMLIRAALILAVLGGASYFAWPHLPASVRARVDTWIRRLPPPLGSGQGTR
ncbi:MAG TPA: serine/threonine-protein kinase [Polyangia bacterium]|nr:serine/threonine-protein kinase [Polyangia bacterium]